MTSLEVFILFSPQIQDANPLSDSEDNNNGKVTLMELYPDSIIIHCIPVSNYHL